jgi:adenylate cyclase
MDELAALTETLDEEALQRANNIMAGPFLDGVEVDGEPFEQWLREQRENARELAISLYAHLGTAFLATSRYQCAIDAAKQALLIDPWNEKIHQLLVSSLSKAGRRADAILHVDEFRQRLWSELGLEPSLELAITLADDRQLHRDALRVSSTQPDARPASRGQTERKQSVVGIFPFELIGEDAAQAYLATGLADEITAELCRFRSLTILARDSMLRVSRSGSDQPYKIGELGATHFVRGSLQVRTSTIRMTVQLVEVATGRLIWSEQYDFGRERFFEVRDDVVSQVVSTLFGTLIDDRIAGIRARPTDSMSAYDCVLRGMAIHKSGHTTKSEAEDAVSWFDRALELDPNYARAHAWRACAAAHLWPAQPSEEHLKRNMNSVEVALSIDPTDSEAHRIKGALHTFQREFEAAIYHLRRAKALNPNDAHLLIKGGLYLNFLGNYEEGLEDISQAMRRNPLHPDWYWRDKGIVLFSAADSSHALDALHCVTENREVDLVYQAACLTDLKQSAKAQRQAGQLLQSGDGFSLERLDTSLPYRCYQDPAEGTRLRELLRRAGLR